MIDPSLNDLVARVLGYGKSMLEMPFSGTPSFFRTDLCDRWQQIDIALIGVPSDAGLSHRPGARYGPQAMRAQSGLIRYLNPFTKVIPYELARVGDIGDLPIENQVNLDPLVEEILGFYRRVHAAGLVPITAGGDHSITYPILKALGSTKPLALVHFDTHHDTVAAMRGTKFHHGAPFRNAVLDGVIDPKRTVQIGIRDPYQEASRPFAVESGMTVIDMVEIQERGIGAAVEKARRVVGDHPAYISFDIDVLDPAYAPGTGTPVVGGLTSREALQLLQGLRGLDVIGGDVVEVSPPFDAAGMTALVGAQIMFEILCLAAEARAVRAERPRQGLPPS
jgi:guanidinopropionase